MFERAERTDAGGAIVFARNFFKNPKMLGSLIPSSRFLIDQLLRDVDWDQTRVVVEYGPGVGTISGEILRRMRPDGKLIVHEINDDFVRVLRKRFKDPRMVVVHRSAADVQQVLREHGFEHADAVISGIPFSIMPRDVKHSILRSTYAAIRPGGRFLVYQFSSHVRRDLEAMFDKVQTGFEPLNILPARLFRCVK